MEEIVKNGDIIRYDLAGPLKYGYFIARHFEYTLGYNPNEVNSICWNVWLFPLEIVSNESNYLEIEDKIINEEINHLCSAKKCIICPINISGRKNKFGWKVIGNKKLSQYELVHPWEKDSNSYAGMHCKYDWGKMEWISYQIEDCVYTFGAPRYDYKLIEYKYIKHLTLVSWISPNLLKFLMTFIYLRFFNFKIEDFFNLDELLKDAYIKECYFQSLNTVLYKDIPKEHWNINLLHL